LDGYSEELKISFEYNGEQHYRRVEKFSSAKYSLSFDQMQINDKLKEAACKKYGVKLIVVPFSVKLGEMHEYILEKCKKLRIKIPNSNKLNYKLFPEAQARPKRLFIRKHMK